MPRAPGFWQRRGPVATALRPAAALYGWIAGWRMRQAPRVRPLARVIAIGNFTTGGAGKTPTVATLADMIVAAGLKPVTVMRGYGGRVRDARQVRPGDAAVEVGDEALETVAHCPVIVAPDRRRGVALAESLGADIILLDDGFQNPVIAKDLALVVVDGGFGLGNGLVFPAGPLRAPLAVQMARADALVLIADPGGADHASAVLALAARSGRPVLRARLVAGGEGWAGRRVFAYAGIGRPEKFRASLAALGAEIAGFVPWPDHHAYSATDARRLIDAATQQGAELVTTAKDHARLSGATDPALVALAAASRVLPVRLVFADMDAVRALVLGA